MTAIEDNYYQSDIPCETSLLKLLLRQKAFPKPCIEIPKPEKFYGSYYSRSIG